MKSIIDFVTEKRPHLKKTILVTFSCPDTHGPGYGFKWEKPAYCNGGRLRNGENVCKKCWERPIGEIGQELSGE